MRLFVDNKEMDLPRGFKIARTKQVNDIVSLEDRQSDFSQNVKLPMTHNNVVNMEFLGYNGSTTGIPYSILNVRLLNDSGESEIENGRMVVFEQVDNDKTPHYRVALYDGFVNFTKAIENRPLTDAGLSDINHLKNLTTVKASWDNDYDYRYHVADYNGKMVYDTNRLNVDYLIPSVKKSFLWDKIFEFAGWSYEGDIFATDDWLNNYMTYPKPIGDGTQVLTAVHTWNFSGAPSYYAGPLGPFGSPVYRWSNRLTHNPVVSDAYLDGLSDPSTYPLPDGYANQVLTDGLYKITFDGVLDIESATETTEKLTIIMQITRSSGPETIILVDEFTSEDTLDPLDHYAYVTMANGDVFALMVYWNGYPLASSFRAVGSMDIDISIVEGDAVDFDEAFIDFEMKDFIDEILWEFALTPFTNSATKTITFLTAEEWTQNETREDWSSDTGKFIRKLSEKYVYGSYARKNYLKHQYNESKADYNDASLSINNANLPDKKTIITSKLFTVEKKQGYIITEYLDVYKFWDKNIKDDETVEYKELENRYYSQRTEARSGSLNIGSETQGTTDTATTWYVANHDRFKWKDVIENRYGPFYAILNTQRLVLAEIYFDDISFANLNFQTPKFIKELGSYFIVNKVPNYIDEGKYPTELLELDLGVTRFDGDPAPAYISLFEADVWEPDGLTYFTYGFRANGFFYNYTPTDCTAHFKQLDNSPAEGGVYTGNNFETDFTFPPYVNNVVNIDIGFPLDPSDAGWYEVQIVDNINGLVSNIRYVHMGDFDGGGTEDPEILANAYDPFDVADFTAEINITYNNFTVAPTTATLRYRKYNFISGNPEGPWHTVALPLTPINTQFTVEINFGTGGYYKYEILTNVVDSDPLEFALFVF